MAGLNRSGFPAPALALLPGSLVVNEPGCRQSKGVLGGYRPGLAALFSRSPNGGNVE